MSSRIGLIADTHIPEAAAELPEAVYRALAGCDRILHCGDLHTIDVVDWLEQIAPTIVSRGNGDTAKPRVRRPGVVEDPRVSDHIVVDVEGCRIGLTHDLSHAEGRRDEDVLAIIERRFGESVDIVVSGHTHVPMVMGLANGTALVNPGSATMPYGYLGLIGTVGILEVSDRNFSVSVIDLNDGSTQLSLSGPAPHPFQVGARPSGGR